MLSSPMYDSLVRSVLKFNINLYDVIPKIPT